MCIQGTPLPNKLEESWDNIIEEYTSLIKTEKTDDVFQLYKKIRQTQWLKDFIDVCLTALENGFDPEIAALISEKGFGIVEYIEDKKIYLRNIKSVRLSAKTLIILLNQYLTEYESLTKNKNEETVEMTEIERRLNIEKEIATLSRFQGQRINKQTMTAFEYAAILNNYIENHKNAANQTAI